MGIEIVRAGEDDAPLVSLLGRITFRETFGHLFEQQAEELSEYLDRTFGVEKIRRSIAEQENRYWIARRDALPIGYAKLKRRSPHTGLEGEGVCQLQKIYVLREFVRHRMGEQLIRAVFEDARAQGSTRVWLDVLRENTRAIGFYEWQGFRTLGEEQYTIGSQTFTFYVMARET